MRADCHGTIHPSWIWMAASLSCRLGILQTGFYFFIFFLFFYFWTHGQVLNSLEIVFVPICSRHAGKFSNFLAWHPRTAVIECCKKSYVLFCLAIKKKTIWMRRPPLPVMDTCCESFMNIWKMENDTLGRYPPALRRFFWAVSHHILTADEIWYSTLPFSWKRTTTLFDCFSLIALVI